MESSKIGAGVTDKFETQTRRETTDLHMDEEVGDEDAVKLLKLLTVENSKGVNNKRANKKMEEDLQSKSKSKKPQKRKEEDSNSNSDYESEDEEDDEEDEDVVEDEEDDEEDEEERFGDDQMEEEDEIDVESIEIDANYKPTCDDCGKDHKEGWKDVVKKLGNILIPAPNDDAWNFVCKDCRKSGKGDYPSSFVVLLQSLKMNS